MGTTWDLRATKAANIRFHLYCCHMLSSSVPELAWEAYSRHEALSDAFNHDPQTCSMASRGTFGSLMQFFGGRTR